MSLVLCICIVFFKQKTAYEMRISDWSSDVCSADLRLLTRPHVDFACDNMPQFGEEWGDGKSYGGDNLPKGGGGGQNEVSCSGGRQDDQCRFGRRGHQDSSLQRRTAPCAADA